MVCKFFATCGLQLDEEVQITSQGISWAYCRIFGQPSGMAIGPRLAYIWHHHLYSKWDQTWPWFIWNTHQTL